MLNNNYIVQKLFHVQNLTKTPWRYSNTLSQTTFQTKLMYGFCGMLAMHNYNLYYVKFFSSSKRINLDELLHSETLLL